MNTKRVCGIFVVFSLLLLVQEGFSQGFLDLKRYSQTVQMGTARSMGMAGAVGAVGADFTASSVNPASLAQFRSNQAVFTAALNFTGNKGNYLGNDVKDNKFNFSLPNMGVVIATVRTSMGKEVTKGLVNYTFAFGFNRVNDFNRNMTIEGVNTGSTYLNYLAEQATRNIDWAAVQSGITPVYPEEMALAANTLVHTANNDFVPNIYPGAAMRQTYRVQQTGRQTDWNIARAGNFSHRIYPGVSLGLPAIRYSQTETLGERSQDTAVNPDRSFEQTNSFTTSGNGVNAKLGLTLRLADWIRLGVAYQTPTSYSLSDDFSYTYVSNQFSGGHFNYTSGQTLSSGPFNSRYNFVTPGKVVVSAAFVNKKIWLLGIDFESIDYTTAQATNADLSAINRQVRSNFRSNGYNLRVGAEYNYTDLRFRAGYAYYSQPFNSDITRMLNEGNLNTRLYTLGIGYEEPLSNIYFDMAYVHSRYDDFYTPYTLEDQTKPYYSALNKVTSNRMVFTVGLRF